MFLLKGAQNKVAKSRRTINKIIWHCSATRPSMKIGVKEIRKWHKQRGWSDIGYHYVIRRNGLFELGRDVNKIGAHVRGQNTGSIGICMVGGVDEYNDAEDNFTKKQWETAKWLKSMMDKYYDATHHGHNEFANKACPSFDVQHETTKGRLK